jgi:excisionase family DNA binding protein
MEPEELFVPIEGATRMLGIKRSKCLQLAYQGEIPSVKIGRSRLFPVAELRAWAAEQVRESRPVKEQEGDD